MEIKSENVQKNAAGRFEGLYNLIGFVNGEPYWLSDDKLFALYAGRGVVKDWIFGYSSSLGTPKNINAWIYSFSNIFACPENETFTNFWNDKTKRFERIEVEEDFIQPECVNQNEIMPSLGITFDNRIWLQTMQKKDVDLMIEGITTNDICGRRPWTNVENHQFLYPEGQQSGFSGLPFGPSTWKRDQIRNHCKSYLLGNIEYL